MPHSEDSGLSAKVNIGDSNAALTMDPLSDLSSAIRLNALKTMPLFEVAQRFEEVVLRLNDSDDSVRTAADNALRSVYLGMPWQWRCNNGAACEASARTVAGQ